MSKTSTNWLSDGYVRRARTYPSLLVAAPFIPFIAYAVEGRWLAVIPAVFVAALMFAANEIARDRGLAVQERLVREWDGMPTTRQLRFRSAESYAVRNRKRASIEAVTGASLPTQEQEAQSPADADYEYDYAVRTAIAIVRDGQSDSDLLKAESASYGFRRNARGLKWFGLATASAAILVAGVFLLIGWPPAIPAVTLTLALVLVLFWTAVVTDKWVTAQSENYAGRFFAVIEGHKMRHH